MALDLDKLMTYPSTKYLPAAKAGVYVERQVLNTRMIQGVLAHCGLPQVNNPHRLHCTVVYSRKAKPVALLYPSVTPLRVAGTEFEYWEGHDKAGYLVLKLDGTRHLNGYHQRWLSAGCVTQFSDYTPHVTLRTPFNKPEIVEEANEKLRDLYGMIAVALSHERLYAL